MFVSLFEAANTRSCCAHRQYDRISRGDSQPASDRTSVYLQHPEGWEEHNIDAIMGHLQGVGIVFGNITNSNTIELTEVASSLGATVLQPADAQRASYLVASNVLRLSDGSDPYLVRRRPVL